MFSDTQDVYGVINELSDTDISAFPSVDATPTPSGGDNGTPTPTPTGTPVPQATPTPTQIMMPTPVVQVESIKYEFSGKTAEENKVTLQGAGFGSYPQANVSFGYIPTDNSFTGATDGQGLIITAKPGEGVMVYGERVVTNKAAMIRCSVRTDSGHAAITIATIGDKPDLFVATNSPNDEAYFSGQYQRLSIFYTPPSTGFLPVVQIVNTSKTETLMAYLDNLEIYPLDPLKYYSAAFLDGDQVDPPANQISLPSSPGSSGFIFDTTFAVPVIPAGVTVVPHPDSNTEVDISWKVTELHLDMIYVQRSTTRLEEDWSNVAVIMFSSELKDVFFTDSNLLPNTLYYYRLLVINAISPDLLYSELYSVRTNP